MTLVVDASAVAEFILGTPRGVAVGHQLGDHQLLAPAHLPVEVLSVVRGWTLGGHVSEARGHAALQDFEDLGVETFDVPGQLPAAFALRHNLSAYDAMYVVLARAVGCALVTLDARLGAAATDCAVIPWPQGCGRERAHLASHRP